MIRLFRYLKTKEWLCIIVCVALIVFQVWLDLRLPDYMADITSLITAEGSNMSDVIGAGGKMLLCALGSLLSAVIVGFLAAKVASTFSKRLRSLMFHKVQRFTKEEIDNFSTASLITRSTNDITQIQMIVAMGLQAMIKAPILAVMAIIKIGKKGNFEWSLLTVVTVAIMLTVIIILMLYALPKFRKIQSLTDNINRVTRENLTGLRVVRAYNAESFQENKFEEANTMLTSNNLKAQSAMTIMMPLMMLVMNGITLGVYWIGAYLIDKASLNNKFSVFSNMIVFSSYAMQVIMAFMLLVMIFVMLPRAQVSAKRICEVLDTKTKIKDGSFSEETEEKGEIRFENVSFAYPDADEYVLENISFEAHKGETVAFIGATGSGKSTIVNLLARFYDVSDGRILVDGVDVKDYKINSLYNKLGYVSQKSVLFSGTVASNVSLGNNGKKKADEEQIKEAVETAQGKEFIEGLVEQYNGFVSQAGSNFSGGQKQRISIARAICRQPEIFIFDDSFSALDYKTDRLLRTELKKKTSGATKLIIAQRIGTIMDADRIIVLDEGKIVGIGKHKELLNSCSVYREIAESQLSKEELEA